MIAKMLVVFEIMDGICKFRLQLGFPVLTLCLMFLQYFVKIEIITKKIQSVCSLIPEHKSFISCCPVLAGKWLSYREVFFLLAIAMFLCNHLTL